MPAPYYLPFILPERYQAFLRLEDSDLPDTYDESLKLHTEQKLQRGRMGLDVREVQVDPDEFARYCGARGIAADGLHLLHFTEEKVAGNNY